MTTADELTIPFNESDDVAERIEAGEVFVYPTDTAFGLGASVYREESVRRVFEIKERSLDKTVPVLTSREKAFSMGEFSDQERLAAEELWPGAFTLVVRAKSPERFPGTVIRDNNLALRVPAHDLLNGILSDIPPITGTSANPGGASTPYTQDDLDRTILEAVDFLLEGEAGGRRSSTVAEWEESEGEWNIHRAGPVSLSQLQDISSRLRPGGTS